MKERSDIDRIKIKENPFFDLIIASIFTAFGAIALFLLVFQLLHYVADISTLSH